MKTNGIRRVGALVLVALMTLAAHAQADLAVGGIFKKYEKMKGCKMVTLSNGKLRGYELQVYKSLTYTGYGADIEKTLAEDRRQARKIREVVADGAVTSGYYMMKPLREGINRYVLFRKNGNNGAVVYIEGKLQPDDIMKICKK